MWQAADGVIVLRDLGRGAGRASPGKRTSSRTPCGSGSSGRTGRLPSREGPRASWETQRRARWPTSEIPSSLRTGGPRPSWQPRGWGGCRPKGVPCGVREGDTPGSVRQQRCQGPRLVFPWPVPASHLRPVPCPQEYEGCGAVEQNRRAPGGPGARAPCISRGSGSPRDQEAQVTDARPGPWPLAAAVPVLDHASAWEALGECPS